MTIVAPLSKYKKQNILIVAALLIGGGVWMAYDGYMSESFQKKHTVDGVADGTLAFHRNSPPFLIGAGLGAGVYFVFAKGRKISVDDTSLNLNKKTIPLGSIEKIDKTHFDKKGYFILTYREDGQPKDVKLSDRTYDNLPAVLDHIVAKIS